MSRKTQMVLILVLDTGLWLAGAVYFYHSYKEGQRQEVSSGIVEITKEAEIDPATGEVVEKNFIESTYGTKLILLSLACGAVILILIVYAAVNRASSSRSTWMS